MKSKILALILIISTLHGLSQPNPCKKDYFEVVDTNSSCVTVSMSDYNYAAYELDRLALEMVRDSIPKIIKKIEKLNRKTDDTDSLRVANQKDSKASLEECQTQRTKLVIKNKELAEDRDYHKNKEGLWRNTSFSQLIVIIGLILLI